MANSFEGLWIPKEILQIEELNSSEKIILAEITALSKDGRCTASNRHIAEVTGIGQRYVEKILPKLKKKGYITSKVYRDDNKMLHRIIDLPYYRRTGKMQ